MMTYTDIATAAGNRSTGRLSCDLVAYVTRGGTWVLASPGLLSDDRKPHDLVAVLPAPLEGSRVVVLRPTVNPDLVDALRAHLDPEVAW